MKKNFLRIEIIRSWHLAPYYLVLVKHKKSIELMVIHSDPPFTTYNAFFLPAYFCASQRFGHVRLSLRFLHSQNMERFHISPQLCIIIDIWIYKRMNRMKHFRFVLWLFLASNILYLATLKNIMPNIVFTSKFFLSGSYNKR